MRARTAASWSTTATVVLVASLVTAPSAQAERHDPASTAASTLTAVSTLSAADRCAPGVARPCVVSASRNGVPVGAADPTWDVVVDRGVTHGNTAMPFGVRRVGGPLRGTDLGAGERGARWSLTIDTGTTVPRVASVHGRDVQVVRTRHGNTHRITVTGHPVRLSDSKDCALDAWPGSCPTAPTEDVAAYFGGVVSDYGSWHDRKQRNAMYGVDHVTNFAGTTPPLIGYDPRSRKDAVHVRLVNHARYSDGTPFSGHVQLRLPKRTLRHVYGVNRPAKLRKKGLRPSIGSGDVRVRKDRDGTMTVTVTGMSAAAQTVDVRRGDVVPGKPRKVRTKRTGPRKAEVRFKKSRVRGMKVDRYVVNCKTYGKGPRARVTTKRTSVRLKGLLPDTRYRCWVRAKSQAGTSKWGRSKVLKHWAPRR